MIDTPWVEVISVADGVGTVYDLPTNNYILTRLSQMFLLSLSVLRYGVSNTGNKLLG